MAFTSVLAGLAVRDIEAAKQWYAAFLGRSPDRVPMASDAEWDFGGTTLQVFSDEKRAGGSSITLEPEDLESELGRLAGLGHEPIQRQSGDFDIAIFEDPDGNQIVLALPAD